MTATILLLCPNHRVGAVRDVVNCWAKRGLVANVGVCSIEDLAERGSGAICTDYRSVQMAENTVEEFLHQQDAGSRLALAALRLGLPSSDGESPHPVWSDHLKQEDAAGGVIREIWHRDEAFTAFTVAATSRAVPLEAFSSWWHLHLVHDRRALQLSNTYEFLADGDHVAGCTLAALSAGGGWSFSGGHAFNRGDDGRDGPIRHARLVRPEVRVVIPLDAADRMKDVTSGSLPERPPWPRLVDVETRVMPSDIMPYEALVDHLAELCGFVVEDPHFGREIDLDGWRGAHSVLRFSFGRVQGDPHDSLRDWQLRVRNEASQVMESFRADDGTGGFITDDAVEAGELFDQYMRDIEIARGAADYLRVQSQSLQWGEFDFDAAVARLREAGIPELTLGVEQARHKRSHCWSLVRRYCFALVDGSDLPEDMSFDLWAYGTGTARPVWRDPSVVAPAPKDDEHPFEVDDELKDCLGVRSIPPIDALVWARADRMIRREDDPFRSFDRDDRRQDGVIGGASSRLQEWADWNSQFSGTPMHQLACRLGDAVADAYGRLADSLNGPDIDDSEQEFLHSLTIFRRAQIASLPLTVAAPVIAIVLGLIGWLTSGSGRLLALALMLIWLAALVFAGVSSWKLIDKTRQFAYAESDRWRWAMSLRHYAVELTRLYEVARAFADHQAVIRTMLHDPLPHSGDHPGDPAKRPDVVASSDDLPPDALLVASAAEDDDVWLQKIKEALPTGVRAGWLTSVYGAVESTWKHRYAELVGDTRIVDPDDDDSAPGDIHAIVAATGERLAGPREHFRSAVVDSSELRAEARARIAMENAGIAEDQQLDAAVRVSRYPAIQGSARQFLRFEIPPVGDPQGWDVFDPGMAGPVAVDHDRGMSSGRDYGVIERWGSDRHSRAFAAFRMLVSESFSPRQLHGIAPAPATKNTSPSSEDLSDNIV